MEAHNELHLGGSTAKIFQLGIQTEQSRLAYPKITRFENRKIWLKIDPKQAKNGPNCFFLAAEIFQLGIQTERSRLAYSKITRFENHKIWLKIDQNRLKMGQIAFSRPWVGEKL